MPEKKIDLSGNSGLPLTLEGSRLLFGTGMEEVQAEARAKEQMKQVLLEPNATDAPEAFYFMHRNVCLKKDEALIAGKNLRYDVTILPAFTVGVQKEFNKTLGHFHEKVKGIGLSFTEVYEVLHGKAHYLLQNSDECFLVEANEGEKVVVPPNFGHVTINPSKNETLAMSNWVEKNFSSDYSLYREKRGATYFETEKGFVENKNYRDLPVLKKVKAKKAMDAFGISSGKPMYLSFFEAPEKLDFLKEPQRFLKEFESLF
ncbi:MAG: glucose-6-phosphate isomerase family protein [Candidatus Diapherotrites archaeon]